MEFPRICTFCRRVSMLIAFYLCLHRHLLNMKAVLVALQIASFACIVGAVGLASTSTSGDPSGKCLDDPAKSALLCNSTSKTMDCASCATLAKCGWIKLSNGSEFCTLAANDDTPCPIKGVAPDYQQFYRNTCSDFTWVFSLGALCVVVSVVLLMLPILVIRFRMHTKAHVPGNCFT